MAKKKNKEQETSIENYYDLRIDKVDELVAVLQDESTEFEDDISYAMNASMGVNDPKNLKRSGKDREFDPYKTDFLGRIPTWLKAVFIKFWFAGAVCYFIMWGIGLGDTLDALALTGVVMGIVVDVLVNPLYRYMESDLKEYNAYMMFPFPFRQIWTFFTNIIYYVIVLVCVNFLYFGLNEFINFISGTQNVIYAGVEPLMFGLFTALADMAFIGIKNGVVAIVRHVKNKNKESIANV